MAVDLFSCMQGFKAIVEHKGFSQAARHLQVSTSMLTGQIKHLERLLKRKLLNKRISPNNEWVLANNKKIYVTGNYASSSGYNVLCAALAGMGLIWCTDILIKEEIRRGELVEIKLKDEQPVAIKMYLYHRRVNADSNIRLMADYLRKIAEIWTS